MYVSPKDIDVNITKPWPMEWGYWYAWTVVVLFQALVFGLNVPLVCPLAALFFYMKYHLDKYNLFYSVYSVSKFDP